MTNPQSGLPSSWPVGLFLGATAIAAFQLAIFAPSLSGRDRANAILLTQAAVIGIVLLRLVVARCRRERNRVWILYVVCLILAAPLWIVVFEPLIAWLRRLTG